jgi:hypothetical protein
MEQTCNRCHQTVQEGACYCPVCGLPQLVYSAENAAAQGQPERWNQAVRDAGSIDWRPGLKLALTLAVPAGIVCSLLSPVNVLVTGMLAGWTSAAASGVMLYAMRYWFHSGKLFDDFWETMVNQQMVQQWTSVGVDAQTIAITRTLMLSPQGRAAGVLCALAFLVSALLIFSVAGGALGARFLGRPRRPEI